MQSSMEKMSKIRREIAWAGGVWFLWGIGNALGKWLQIDPFKDQKDVAWLWLGFGVVVILFVFIADCTEAILTRINETTGQSQLLRTGSSGENLG